MNKKFIQVYESIQQKIIPKVMMLTNLINGNNIG